ncbi:hypothetical protein QR46_1672 [Giardia duodenalis assemblage B]|uniref:CFA20 domain-containing protein n=1 Tax=Giardia duodenalis assemblage B TaxID=1394984 RepID=A0A132NW88_GIAIN|nr:hypothetical protein QR46_1672 [Giardia intestinalis assemblage B]
MFKRAYQGGPFISLLDIKGQAPAQGWNMKKASITRNYNKEMKTYVLDVDGPVGSKITMPEAPEKQVLGITQPFLLMQLFIPKDQIFSLNLGVIDYSKNRIRLYFSTANKVVKVTSLHARLPLHAVAGAWSCLVFDLAEITRSCFPTSEFASLNSIEIMPCCTLLRVFTVKTCPLPTLELYCPKDEEDARTNPRMPKPRFSIRQYAPLDKKVEVGIDVHVQVLDEFYLSLFRENKPNTDLAVRDRDTLLDARREFIPGYRESEEGSLESAKTVKNAPLTQASAGTSATIKTVKSDVGAASPPQDSDHAPERTYNVLANSGHEQPSVQQPSVHIRHGADTKTTRTRQAPKPTGTGSIRAAIEFNTERDGKATVTTTTTTSRDRGQDPVRQGSKIPQLHTQEDGTMNGIDLTLNAIPVMLKPEQCGKSATSANGVTTDRATTPVTRLKGVRVGLVDDEVLGSMVDTNYAVMGDAHASNDTVGTSSNKVDTSQMAKSMVNSLVTSNKAIPQDLIDTVYSVATHEGQPDSEDIEDYDGGADDLGGQFTHACTDVPDDVNDDNNASSYSYYSTDGDNDDIPDPAPDEEAHSAIPEPATNLRLASQLSGGIRYDEQTGVYLEIDDSNIPGPMDD